MSVDSQPFFTPINEMTELCITNGVWETAEWSHMLAIYVESSDKLATNYLEQTTQYCW